MADYDVDVVKSFLSDSLIQEEVYHYIKKMLIDAFKLSNVSKTPHYKIMSFLIFNYMVGIEHIKISYLKKKLGIYGNKLNTTINDLVLNGFITCNGGAVALSHNFINIIFNLINQMQNSNYFVDDFIGLIEDEDIRLSELKKLAREFLKGKNYLSYFEKNIIGALFNLYVDRANSLKLVFVKEDAIKVKKEIDIVKKEDSNVIELIKMKAKKLKLIKDENKKDDVVINKKKVKKRKKKSKKSNGEKETKRKGKRDIVKELKYLQKDDLLFLNYKTRFNSFGVIRKKINELEEIISNASKIYPYSIFMTLTTDINRFNSVLDAYKEINKNWNRLVSAITKKLGYRPKYVKVLEFHKNGNPHLHILLFVDKVKVNGEWILKQDWVSEKWDKYGQGKIVYLFALKSNGKTYNWLNAYPKNTKTDNITAYLSKYFKKAFNDDLELSLFWVSNLRFYTYSRGLKEVVYKESKGIWAFLGVFSEDDLNDINDFIERLRNKYVSVEKERRNFEIWFNIIDNEYKCWICG